jgi:hypothetical protein
MGWYIHPEIERAAKIAMAETSAKWRVAVLLREARKYGFKIVNTPTEQLTEKQTTAILSIFQIDNFTKTSKFNKPIKKEEIKNEKEVGSATVNENNREEISNKWLRFGIRVQKNRNVGSKE